MKKSIFIFIVFIIVHCTFIIEDCICQWVQTNMPTGVPISNIAVSNDNIFAATGSLGIFRSTNNGLNWISVNNGLTILYVSSIAFNGDNIFIGTGDSGGGGVFLSTNNGENWVLVNNNFPNVIVQALVIDNGYIFAGTEGSGIFLSTNNGGNWTSVNNGLTDYDVFTLAACNGNIYAGTWGGGVFRSTNNGLSWTNIGLANSNIDAVKANNNNIYAGLTFGGGAYLSTNNGINWFQINNGLPSNTSVHEFLINGNNLFAGTSKGVYLTSNNGTNWFSINLGMGNFTILSLAINNLYMFSGTGSNGIWRRLISNITVVNEYHYELPNKYFLSQNYPNPFNANTIIRFQIKDSRFVKLKVFDLLGREVATLVNEYMQPGTYEVRFDAGDLPSGVYFYRLQTEFFTETKKLILLK